MLEPLSRQEQKIIEFFWSKKKRSLEEVMTTHVLKYLLYGEIGDNKFDAILELQIIKLVRKNYLLYHKSSKELLYLTDKAKVYLSKRHSSFADRLEKFNSSFPPLLITISSITGVIVVIVEIIKLFSKS